MPLARRTTMISICPKRTQYLHNLFAEIGATCRFSVTRLGYSDLETAAHEKFSNLILQIPGWKKSIDVFGNTHFTLAGSNPHLPPIRIGSHLDSVNTAGLFDGTSGCIAALQIAEYLYNHGIMLKNTLVISLWRCEESTRFGTAMIGSRLFCGQLSFSSLNQITDGNGISVLGGMISQGLQESAIKSAIRNWQVPATAFKAELHIEQGPELHEAGVDVGIVSGFCGTWRADIQFRGRKDHSSRKRNARVDAMEAAMFAGAEIYSLAKKYSEYPVITIGGLNSDGSMNCIAGNVNFTVDVRGLDVRTLQSLGARIEKIVAHKALEYGVTSKVNPKGLVKPIGTSRKLQNLMIDTAKSANYSYQVLSSGAGHDAMSFALAGFPSIMVFAPSWTRKTNGAFSHSPDEYASAKKLAKASTLMLNAILSF